MNLKSDILSPRLAIFQSIAQLAPLPTLIFTIQEIFGYSDAPALSYLIALVIVLFSVNTVMQMGSRFPNAGGYYSYVAKGISKSAGVYTQFLYLFYQVLNTAAVVIFSSWVLQIFLGIFGYQIRGFYLLAIPLVMIFVVPYFGIRISAMFYLITALIEIGIVLVLSVLLVAFPNSSSSFSAPMIPHVGISAFALSIIYSLFFFTGYGSVLTLAEETKTPRKSIPLMALFSVVGIGLLEFFYIYASDVNWGTSLTATFASASTFPTFISAQRFLGVFGLVITGSFAYISFLKGNIAIQNATSRGIFALARDGVIPKRLSAVHRRYGSPHLAIIFNEVVSLIIIAVVYLVFYFILGIHSGVTASAAVYLIAILTVGYLLTHIFANISVPWYFTVKERRSLSLTKHYAMPIISTAAIIFALGLSFTGLTGYMVSLPVIVALYLLFAFLYTYRMIRSHPEVIANAGEIRITESG